MLFLSVYFSTNKFYRKREPIAKDFFKICNWLFLFYNKDVLNELLEIAKNKEYKDVNFPIISTLNQYKNKRVKMFFEKNRME